jgi:hypothetical protein
LLKKIEALPIDRISEVEDFVEFIAAREQERSLTRAAAAARAPALAAIWSNPEDDAYTHYEYVKFRRYCLRAVSIHQSNIIETAPARRRQQCSV